MMECGGCEVCGVHLAVCLNFLQGGGVRDGLEVKHLEGFFFKHQGRFPEEATFTE